MTPRNRLKIGSKPSAFDTFDFQLCFAPQRSGRPKVVRRYSVLIVLTWKNISCHNSLRFFDIWTSKSGLRSLVFNTFYLQMCFSLQRRMLFRHLDFEKRSGAEMACTFWLGNARDTTTVCKFISHPASWLCTGRFSEPIFRTPKPANHWKSIGLRNVSSFSHTCIFFFLTFSLSYSPVELLVLGSFGGRVLVEIGRVLNWR